MYAGYFTSDNENATHNTFATLTGYLFFDLKNVKHSLLCSFVNFDINVIFDEEFLGKCLLSA
jgi:hypothetical protein